MPYLADKMDDSDPKGPIEQKHNALNDSFPDETLVKLFLRIRIFIEIEVVGQAQFCRKDRKGASDLDLPCRKSVDSSDNL